MRLMIVVDGQKLGDRLMEAFFAAGESWQPELVFSPEQARKQLMQSLWQGLILQGVEGKALGNRLLREGPSCPPVTLFLWEEGSAKPAFADCSVSANSSPSAMAKIMEIMIKKPLPTLAAARREECSRMVCGFLEQLGMEPFCKGWNYARWCLERCVPSPMGEKLSMQTLYDECARCFSTTGAAVERCLRTAVENVFTMGNLSGTERFYGGSVDPERGKPTNRAFLVQGVRQIRLLLDSAALGKKQ
ncbi:MAG: hypothetical protein E7331_06925 [Clostridiales bacterium]|nr:hypothetical protein [Clostridiales bacterium]